MKQLSTPAKLIWLFTMLVFFGSCAPKYGLHFQPNSGDSYVQKAPVAGTFTADINSAEPSLELLKADAPIVGDAIVPSTDGQATLPSDVEMPAYSLEMSKKEQRHMIKELRKKLNNMSAEDREALKKQAASRLDSQKASPAPASSGASGIDPVLLVILTILIPPLGVYLYYGDINDRFWISLILTLLFYIPGLIFSLLVIFGAI